MSDATGETVFNTTGCLADELEEFVEDGVVYEVGNREESSHVVPVTNEQAEDVLRKLQVRRSSMGELVCSRSMCFATCLVDVDARNGRLRLGSTAFATENCKIRA